MGKTSWRMFAAGCLGLVSSQAMAADLTIWWNKGYYPEEDERFEQIVADYEATSGKEVELNFFVTEDLPRKTLAALEAGEPPDLAMGHLYDFFYTSRWAAEDKLADVTDVLEPIKDQFDKASIESVYLYNGATDSRAYYAIPTQQQTAHVHYWKSMLEEAGFTHDDIPLDNWDGFWKFWCEEVQPAARKATGNRRIYGVGHTMSSASSDTIFFFMHFLNAYGGRILNEDGKVVLGEEANRKALLDALESFTYPYRTGCTPPGSVNWQDPDNNVNFLNKVTVMTPNPTLSVPASQINTNPEAYNDIITMEWPDGPNGEPITYMTAIKTAVIFKDGDNVENAKDFVRHLLQPDVIGPYIEGSLGRWYPVMKEAQARPFWTETDDQHRQTLVRQYTQRETRPFPMVYNTNYTKVQAENYIGQAVGKIILEDESIEDAADWLIQRITETVEG